MDPKIVSNIKETITKSEVSLIVIDKDIRTAKKAGIDTKRLEETYNKLKNTLALLKGAYL